MELPHKTLYIWRVSNYPDLKGHGGLIADGRWHTKGQCIVYCAQNIECAIGEIEKHLDVPRHMFPANYVIIKVRVPAPVKIIEFKQVDLPTDWRTSYLKTQPIGDAWLSSIVSPMAKVPSALFDGFSNYLINPTHRMADFIEVEDIKPVSARGDFSIS